MTDLQKAAEAFVERWVPADSRTGVADYMKQRVCRHDFLSGAAYRDAEVNKLREALEHIAKNGPMAIHLLKQKGEETPAFDFVVSSLSETARKALESDS